MNVLLSHRNDVIYPETILFSTSVRDALEKLGNIVTCIGFGHPGGFSPLSVMNLSSYDLLLHLDNGRQQTQMTENIDAFKGPKICWLVHAHSDYATCVRVGKQFDHIFTAVYNTVKRLKDDTKKPSQWLPLAVDPNKLYPDPKVESQYDIGFIGREQRRADILLKIVSQFQIPDPTKWNQKDLELTRVMDEFNEHPIPIVVRPIKCFVGEAWGDAYRVAINRCDAIFNKQHSTDLNFRVFETMACQKLLITDENVFNGQNTLFEKYNHYLTYTDETELIDVIMFSMKWPKRRKQLVDEGYREVLAKHTFDHRVKTILEIVK